MENCKSFHQGDVIFFFNVKFRFEGGVSKEEVTTFLLVGTRKAEALLGCIHGRFQSNLLSYFGSE